MKNSIASKIDSMNEYLIEVHRKIDKLSAEVKEQAKMPLHVVSQVSEVMTQQVAAQVSKSKEEVIVENNIPIVEPEPMAKTVRESTTMEERRPVPRGSVPRSITLAQAIDKQRISTINPIEKDVSVSRTVTFEEHKRPISPVQPFQSRSEEESEMKRGKDLESFLGVNLLSKIGIATLVLGVIYFVKYSIDQNWISEIGRVAIGILAGGIIIGIAHKLRKNYKTFSSILIGGGIAILYGTIALAYWDYKIFSQPIAFCLLILTTALSTFLAIVYDKKELAIFSLIGGFASPLMVSSGTGNYLVLFSYILILNSGMLVLAFKKHWNILCIIAYVLTLTFYVSWIYASFTVEYIGASFFGLLYFIQFYLVAIFDHLNRERKLSVFQVFYILGNNLFLFTSLLYIVSGLKMDLKGMVTVSLALLNSIPLWILFRKQDIDKNMLYLLIGIVLSLVSLAIPIQLSGCAITMFWAAETVILLFLYQKSNIRTFKFGYLIIQGLLLVSLGMDWANHYFLYPAIHLSIIINQTCITGLVVLASVIVNARLFRNDTESDDNDDFSMKTILNMLVPILFFGISYLELRHQLDFYCDSGSFINEMLGTYLYSYLAAYALIKRNKNTNMVVLLYTLICFAILSFVLVYLMIVVSAVKKETLTGLLSNSSYFMIHFLAFPAIIIFFRFLLRQTDRIGFKSSNKNWIYWLLSVIAIVVLSLELDSILAIFSYKTIPMKVILKNSHTIGFPILWGVSALLLMILGMKRKERTLRIISLALFSLIILKLYLIDIWSMNQLGRIVAFIVLGIIFVLVSFLYQKLKVLLLKEENMEGEIVSKTTKEHDQ